MKELPPLEPELQTKVSKLHADTNEVLDRYISGITIDMNRHAVKHSNMPEDRALNDLARILARDVPPGMLAGLLAAAILRLIKRTRQGRG